MQVKGHIAKMALCLEDSNPRIAALAQLFFHELSKKEFKVGAPYLVFWSPQRTKQRRCLVQVDCGGAREAILACLGHLPPACCCGAHPCPAGPSLLPRYRRRPCARQPPPVPPPSVPVQGTSPIYNLLPDILSNLSKETDLKKSQFQAIMQHVRGR